MDNATPERPAVGISRRTVMKGAAALTAAMAGANAMANGHSHEGSHDHIVDSTLQCKKDAEACMHHLVTEMANGASDLGTCAHKVSEAMAVCESLLRLAVHDSSHLEAMAKVAVDVKRDCVTECDKHADAHEACAALARSCRSCIEACESISA
ncbi:MAG: twin-arginine translocation signal domain-containing protein [Pseudomonadales bacterium]|nr:twin-arginine translocation signal domain-containing protein [Pseudomonadales bacterium]